MDTHFALALWPTELSGSKSVLVIWMACAQRSVSVCHLDGLFPDVPYLGLIYLNHPEMSITDDKLTWHRAAQEEHLT